MRKLQCAALVLLILAPLHLVPAQTMPIELLEAKTLQQLEEFDQDWDGVIGVAALDLTTNRLFSYHGDVLFPQASSIKIPIMIEIFRQAGRGAFKLSDEFEIAPAMLVGGSGRYQEELRAGKTLKKPLLDIVRAMIIWSDNVATNVCIDLAGMEQVNQTLRHLGLHATRLQRKMMDGEAVARNDENISTPVEMVRLMQMLQAGIIVDGADTELILNILAEVADNMRAGVPSAYRVAAKPGGVPAVACETGIIFFDQRPFALSVMSTFNGDGAGRPVQAVTEIMFKHFEKVAHSNVYGHRTTSPPAK